MNEGGTEGKLGVVVPLEVDPTNATPTIGNVYQIRDTSRNF